MAFLLEQNMIKDYFDDTIFNQVYQDDRLAIFNWKICKEYVAQYLYRFQQALSYYTTRTKLNSL